jgi:aspartyl-tRNA(Asn)/glutamyl-tRNA(Gln) amidotransferase subunit A
MEISRREFFQMSATAAAAGAYAGAAAPSDDLAKLTIAEASKKIRSGEISCVELTEACPTRAKGYNPKVNAYITIMSEPALTQARALDAEAKAGKFRGPLHGIPIALKDNIDTMDARTTGGSAVFEDRFPDEDADVVRRLKTAGAVIIVHPGETLYSTRYVRHFPFDTPRLNFLHLSVSSPFKANSSSLRVSGIHCLPSSFPALYYAASIK